MSYIGVDLHTTQITVCYLKAEDDFEMKKYQLCEIEKFVSSLQLSDEIAVEATGNTRWFVEQVKRAVKRVVLVASSANLKWSRIRRVKTDKRDALNLARFLRADLLPEVRAKAEETEKMQSLVNTRTRIGEIKNQSAQ